MAELRFVALLGVVLSMAGAAPARSAAPIPAWESRFFDPNPANDDFILPMPCGGAMVFRRVETPTGPNPLDDRPVVLGAPDPDTDYAEFVRPAFVAGGFGEAGKRFYYLAKYELTKDQATTLTGGPCAPPTMQGRVPVTGIGWFDANELAYKYNQWLYKKAREQLPIAEGAVGFVRLPTEVEWEYAARGGTAVSETEFRDRLFPMKEDIARYAWVQGPQSGDGRPHPVGLLLPNPLGFYDIIGNAAEIVLDPFRLNKVGRLNGEAGGFIVKGGDFETAGFRLRSSMRPEIPPFNARTGDPTRLPTVGVRFALAVPAITGIAQAAQLHGAFATLARPAGALPGDPQRLIAQIIQSTVDPGLKRRLQVVGSKLAEETRAHKEYEARAVESSIRSGAILIRDIRDMDRRIRAIGKFLNEAKADQSAGFQDAGKRVVEYSTAVAQTEARQRISLDTYAHLVVQVSEDYPYDVVSAESHIVTNDFKSQNLLTLPPFAQLFIKHVGSYRTTKSLASQSWLQEILR